MTHTWTQPEASGRRRGDGQPHGRARHARRVIRLHHLPWTRTMRSPTGVPHRATGRRSGRDLQPAGRPGNAAVPGGRHRQPPASGRWRCCGTRRPRRLGSSAAAAWKLPSSTVPVVLFIWGPGRIVPVRVTDADHHRDSCTTRTSTPPMPRRSSALRVLTPAELAAAHPDDDVRDRPGHGRLQLHARRCARRWRPPTSPTPPSRSSG